jgi:hypothetical protein
MGRPMARDLAAAHTVSITGRGGQTVHELYGISQPMTDEEYASFANRWKPYRTWALLLIRAAAHRLGSRDRESHSVNPPARPRGRCRAGTSHAINRSEPKAARSHRSVDNPRFA